ETLGLPTRSWLQRSADPQSSGGKCFVVCLPFDVGRWRFDVGCSSGFMGSLLSLLRTHRDHKPSPSPAPRAPSPPPTGGGEGGRGGSLGGPFCFLHAW